MISNAQPPPTHPAMQMRKYYADVYTGSSIVEFESACLDSILMIVSALVVKAQVISVYSYVDNPYKNRQIYGIFKNPLEKVLCVLLFLVIVFSLISLVRRTADRSIIIGHPDNIIVISPEESQDVIVIGDPESIKVKPKNK